MNGLWRQSAMACKICRAYEVPAVKCQPNCVWYRCWNTFCILGAKMFLYWGFKVIFALIALFWYRGLGRVNKPWLRARRGALYPERAKNIFSSDTALHVILWSSVLRRSSRFVSSFYLFLFATPSFACACFCSSLYLLSSEAARRCNDKCTRSDLWVFITRTCQQHNKK